MESRINIDRFLDKYLNVLPMSVFAELNRQSMLGRSTMMIDTDIITELNARLADKKAEEKRLKNFASKCDKGTQLEKEGKVEKAIALYEKLIQENDYPASHPYERLMILYRKAKEYEKEIKIINLAIEIVGAQYEDLKEKYTERLDKAIQLKEKSKR